MDTIGYISKMKCQSIRCAYNKDISFNWSQEHDISWLSELDISGNKDIIIPYKDDYLLLEEKDIVLTFSFKDFSQLILVEEWKQL